MNGTTGRALDCAASRTSMGRRDALPDVHDMSTSKCSDCDWLAFACEFPSRAVPGHAARWSAHRPPTSRLRQRSLAPHLRVLRSRLQRWSSLAGHQLPGRVLPTRVDQLRVRRQVRVRRWRRPRLGPRARSAPEVPIGGRRVGRDQVSLGGSDRRPRGPRPTRPMIRPPSERASHRGGIGFPRPIANAGITLSPIRPQMRPTSASLAAWR